MHALTCLHTCGHLYQPGGFGELEFDPAQCLTAETIVETRKLPGFVEDNTTYESHTFWVHFARFTRTMERESERDSSVLIRVHHGGGWEVWRGDWMLARALRRYGDNDRGLFLLCWYLRDSTRAARDAGRTETAAEYRRAFVEGRLKKRKLPNRGECKVWIDPAPTPAQTAT
ncbi:hypothetical protein ACVMIH_001721 [Bradyrhizobium sp. USDA 4503]